MTTTNDTKMKGELVQLTEQQESLAEQLDLLAQSGLACVDLKEGFRKAMLTAICVEQLRGALSPVAMEPIMALQDSALGFRTDKDRQGGYSRDVVRDALINAVMVGLLPCGNMFNIIAGRMYITKEGFTYLLDQAGVSYTIDQAVPVSKQGGAIVETDLRWEYRGENGEKHLSIPVRVNAGMGADAILGKADRKAKCWLYNNLRHTTLADGDASEMREVTGRVVSAAVPALEAAPAAPEPMSKQAPADELFGMPEPEKVMYDPNH